MLTPEHLATIKLEYDRMRESAKTAKQYTQYYTGQADALKWVLDLFNEEETK